MLWFALAVMTGLAMGFALGPLAFRGRRDDARSREAEFYRAQLDEIGRDVERGQLPAAEAASARAEAARRLLAVSPDLVAEHPNALARRRAAVVAIFLVVPAVALAVYTKVGAPDLPDAPLASRKSEMSAPGGVETAIARVEAHLMQAPDDRGGWEVLAPVYMRMGRFADAAGAYRRVIALGADTPAVRADFGQALVAMSDGVVTADARAQFEKAPDLPMAKFYLALALEQEGKADEAKTAYAALEPQAQGRAPWAQMLHARLAAMNGTKPEATPPADAAFSPDQRKMIEGMVAGLAARLATKGGSAEEWGRLIRAYSVLHETEKARNALASARKALGDNTDIAALARELGI